MMQDEQGLITGPVQDAGGFHEDQANAKAYQEQFKDKFGRNHNYTLYYYEWNPNNNQANLF